MRICLVLIFIVFLAPLGTGCGKKNTLAASTDTKSRKNATLREAVEQASGVASRFDVPVVEITSKTLSAELSVTGELVPEKSVVVKSLMDGRITFRHPLNVGDKVKKGEVVATIDDRDVEDEIRQQRRQVEISEEKITLDEENLAQKRKSVEIDKQLCAKSFISKNELEKSQMETKQLELGLWQSRNALEQEKGKLAKAIRQREKVSVAAPFSGMVVPAAQLLNEGGAGGLATEEIMSLDGTLVNTATPLFGLLSQQGFLAMCLVNGKDVARIAVGQNVKLTVISHKPIEITGRVARLSTVQDQKSRAHKVWIALEKMDPSFTSGLFVRANVELERHIHATVVARDYVKERDNRSFVQVVERGLVRDAWTTTGITQGDLVEILSGVKLGEMLIASKETFSADQAVNPVRVDKKDGKQAEAAALTPAQMMSMMRSHP